MKDTHLQEWLLATDGIATRLRELRGMRTGKDFAAFAGMRPAKLSKLELGQQLPTEDDIRSLVTAAGEPEAVAEQLAEKLRQIPNVRTEGERQLRFSQVAAQRRLNERLRAAGHVRIFESLYIPRPLQHPAYSRLALAQAGQALGSAEGAEQAANTLAGSAQFLYEPARRFDITITESVLRWQAPDPDVTRAQLERLLQVATLPNLTLRIVPLDLPLPVLPAASFALYDDTGYLDSLDEGTQLTAAGLAGHVDLMGHLERAAVRKSGTRAIVQAALARVKEGSLGNR